MPEPLTPISGPCVQCGRRVTYSGHDTDGARAYERTGHALTLRWHVDEQTYRPLDCTTYTAHVCPGPGVPKEVP